jgi:hypothetical protein
MYKSKFLIIFLIIILYIIFLFDNNFKYSEKFNVLDESNNNLNILNEQINILTENINLDTTNISNIPIQEVIPQLEKLNQIDFSLFKPQIINPNKKIAIVYVFTYNIYDYAQHSIKNLTNYANKHNYTLIIYDQLLSPNVSPCWNKVLAILGNLKNYDYVMWIDADAIIYNQDVPITKFTNENNSKELLICYDCAKESECINSGVMIVKNTDWAYNLFKKTWESPIHHGHNDQNVLYNVILSESYPERTFQLKFPEICSDDVHPKVGIFSENTFNSHITNYLVGDFAIHLMGLDAESRINIMRQINSKLGIDDYQPKECIKTLETLGKKEFDKEIRDIIIPKICYLQK